MNKDNIVVLKGNLGGEPNQTTSTSTSTNPTGCVINTLQDDINADNTGTLSNLFNNFTTNLVGDVENFIQQLNNQNVSAIQGFGNLQSILQSVVSGYLANQTYQYKSNYLLTWWTNNIQQIALNIAVDFGLWFCNWCNTFFNAYSYQQTSNVIVGNTYGTVSNSGNSTYHANTVMNANNSTTIANINAQMGTPNGSGTTIEGLGGFTPEWNPQGSGTTANQITLNNSAMNNDTTPIANSSADVGGTSTNTMNSIEIANFSQQGFKLFTEKLQSVLYNTFKEYFLSFADVDLNVEGFNW